MKLLIVALLSAASMIGQATGTATTTGSCSPATTGSRNTFTISCGIDKEQGDQMLKILNKILADRLEPSRVLEKLDEILHAVNPNAPRITYTFNGFKRTSSPGSESLSSDGADEVFKQLGILERANSWTALIALSEMQMERRPEWLTPYVLAGEGYMKLGQAKKALGLLESAEKKIAGNPEYDQIQKSLNQMLTFLRAAR